MRPVANIDVLERIKQAAEIKAAADPALVKTLLAGGVGALGGGALSALLTHSHDEAARERSRNTAFGAGVAAGLAGPRIVDVLHAAQHPAQGTQP